MKKLILNAVAYINEYESNPDLTKDVNEEKGYEIYLKNAFVCLKSILKNNNNCDTVLITNIKLDEYWLNLFNENEIKIIYVEYNKYLMSKDIIYSLSYYKLCALDYCINNLDYDMYCMIDCDCICVNSFDNIWKEACDELLIIPNESGIDKKIRREMIDIYCDLFHTKDRHIVHESSGFIAGTKNDLLSLMELCNEAYEKLIHRSDLKPIAGDEIIWSLALANYERRYHSPKPYVLLENIGFRSYYVDKKDVFDNEIVVWHLPTEKRYSLIWAFDYFIRTNNLPTLKKMAKASRIRIIKNRFSPLSIFVIVRYKGTLKRNFKKLFH